MIRFIPIFLILFLLPTIRTNGCGIDFLHEEYRIAWFNPKLIADPALYPFYFHTYIDFQYSADPELQDYRRNCREWATYMGPAVLEKDVLTVLYKNGPEYFLNALDGKELSVRYPRNTFIQQLQQADKAEALAYLTLAMQAEFAHFSTPDPWGLDETAFDFFERITPLIRQAQQKVKTLEDPFLRRRYAYQLVVQFRYAENAEECTRYCDEYFNWNDSESVLVPWAQYYKAEAIGTQGNAVESAYLFSKVFDHCESKKIRVTQLFDQSILEDVLRKAQNAPEKASIYALAAYKHPGKALDLLESLAKTMPESRYLPHLITREINKLEDWILTPRLTFFNANDMASEDFDYEDPSNFMPGENQGLLAKEIPYLQKNLAKDKAYLTELCALLEGLLKTPAFQQTDFAHLAAAHLYYLNNQAAAAHAHLEKIADRNTPTIQLQKTLTQLLILPDQIDIRFPEAKEEIARGLSRIKALAKASEKGLRIYPKLMLYFSRAYQQKGDAMTAGLFYNHSMYIPKNTYQSSDYYNLISYFDRFASLKDIDAFIALSQKKNPSALEKLLLSPLDALEKERLYDYTWDESDDSIRNQAIPSLEQIYDLKGTIALRQNLLPEALEAFEHLPDQYWQDNYAFKYHLEQEPFATVQTYPWQGEPQKMYNKKEVLRRMIELQKQAEQPGPRQAEACYLLGNAYYNFSYWGKNWMMFSYGRSNVELYQQDYYNLESFSFSPNGKTYYDTYYLLSRAMAYYQKAYQSKPEVELSARIVFMMGTCDKWIHLKKASIDWFEEKEETYISPFFNTFRDQFEQTAAFRECINNCPELADYFKK